MISTKEKGILDNTTPEKQFLKTAEEVGEVAKALGKKDMDELEDGIGDVGGNPNHIGSSMPEYAFTLINGTKIEAETIKELEDAFKFLNPLFLAPVKEAALKKGLKVVGIGANLKIEKYTKPQCPVEVVYVKK